MGRMSEKDIEVQNFLQEYEDLIREDRFNIVVDHGTREASPEYWEDGQFIDVDTVLSYLQDLKRRDVLR